MALEKVLQLRLPEQLKAQLEEIARVEGRSLGDVVRRALTAYVAQRG